MNFTLNLQVILLWLVPINSELIYADKINLNLVVFKDLCYSKINIDYLNVLNSQVINLNFKICHCLKYTW